MEFIVELIIEVFGEFLLQVVFEALAEVFSHAFNRGRPRSSGPGGPSAALRAVGYVLLGAAAGAVSLWVAPHHLLHSPRARLVYLAGGPVLVGALMALVGVLRQRRGDERLGLDRFAYGYLFALAFALVRYFFAGSAG